MLYNISLSIMSCVWCFSKSFLFRLIVVCFYFNTLETVGWLLLRSNFIMWPILPEAEGPKFQATNNLVSHVSNLWSLCPLWRATSSSRLYSERSCWWMSPLAVDCCIAGDHLARGRPNLQFNIHLLCLVLCSSSPTSGLLCPSNDLRPPGSIRNRCAASDVPVLFLLAQSGRWETVLHHFRAAADGVFMEIEGLCFDEGSKGHKRWCGWSRWSLYGDLGGYRPWFGG